MNKRSCSSQEILARAKVARASNPSPALDRVILNIALGARSCYAGSDLLVESLSNPGKVYTVDSAGQCDCRATRPCWHQCLAALLLDPPGDNPLGDEEGDSPPAYSIGARIAIARRALLEAL
jgi:hypothetical protein